MSSWYPPPSKPRPVDGGIKARSARGVIAQTWWSQRFIEVLESLGMGTRLQRGRNYARRGQVISLSVGPGQVTAQVQGSRARPYAVRIGVPAFGKSEWALVESALSKDAWYAADLLSGEMPSDIENVFDSVGLSLFPTKVHELSLDCTCPDSAVPCKHLAATFYLLAELFDDEPFEIFSWRGRDRQDLLANVSAARPGGGPAADRAERSGPQLADVLDSFFWRQNDIPAVQPAVTSSTALLDQLPAVPITVRGRGLTDILRPLYEALPGTTPLA